ncbi:MAG: hypothetical protein JSS91_05095 [Bacteroidetes bacterium]|nr:hypothetical protein [Bacteroidota bacterium]
MKKFILFISAATILCSFNIFAQVANYQFTDSIGTYNEITGDTIASATHTSQDPGNLNDVTYGPINLPFTFTFNGIDYASYFVNTNGYITFGSTAPALADYTPVSGSETYEGAVSAFGLDLIGVFGTTIDFSGVTYVLSDVRNFQGVVIGAHITAATGIPADTYITAFDPGLGTITISKPTTDIIVNDLVVQIASGSIISKTEGVTPNRVHTIQFKNFRQYIIIGTDDNFNFQIKLFEHSLNRPGEIHIVYGNMDKANMPVPSVFGQVGLRGYNNSDWNNRTNSGSLNWETSSAGLSNAATSELRNSVFPVSGLTYIWRPQPSTLNITVIPEAFYNAGTNLLSMSDTFTAYLHSNVSPYNVIDSAVSVIDSVTFTGAFIFKNAPNGIYYIRINHRNTIETWSRPGGEIFTSGNLMNYNFTDLITKAFGNNLINVDNSPLRYAIYSGDVNQDGTIDLTDGSLIDNDAFNFISGYVQTDVNGDGIVDLADAVYADNNALNFVSRITP